MEFFLMKLEVESVMPESIFGVIEDESRGLLPAAASGHWVDYSAAAERDFRFAAAAKRAITKSGCFLGGTDAIDGWGHLIPGHLEGN